MPSLPKRRTEPNLISSIYTRVCKLDKNLGRLLQIAVASKLFKVGQEHSPFVFPLRLEIERERKIRHEMRALWLSSELHVGLLGGLIRLLKIAASTASDEVIPSVRATCPFRHDVVNRQVLSLHSAVLARVAVTR